jgi:uncharacterized protein
MQLLVIETARIPPEGLDIEASLDAPLLHLEGDREIMLGPGGEFRGRAELVEGETLHISGRFVSPFEVECGRCLDRFSRRVDERLDLFFMPRRQGEDEEQEEDVRLADRDLVVGYYEGGRLDLGDVLREQLLLSLPLKRVCREACQGLCPSCGCNRNRASCSCPETPEPADPRLEGLRRLLRG